MENKDEIFNIALLVQIYEKAALCREFEKSVFEKVRDKVIQIPVYLSAGQEYAPASIASFYSHMQMHQRQIFIQHRGHSTYLAFGGNLHSLMNELLGKTTGCASGVGGSASIHSVEANIYGHDGLMGSQGPISVGMCFGNKLPTFCFIGDAAAEEDYFLAALGWASTKKLPIIFIVEDNNLSILTEKKIRRNWDLFEVARAFKIEAYDLPDNPYEIISKLHKSIEKPMLLNINTTRLFWHSGAGIDGEYFDRHLEIQKLLPTHITDKIDREVSLMVKKGWDKCLCN